MGGRGRESGGGVGESTQKQSGLGQAYKPYQAEAPVKGNKEVAANELSRINQILGRRK